MMSGVRGPKKTEKTPRGKTQKSRKERGRGARGGEKAFRTKRPAELTEYHAELESAVAVGVVRALGRGAKVKGGRK